MALDILVLVQKELVQKEQQGQHSMRRVGGWLLGSYPLLQEELLCNRRDHLLEHRGASFVRKCPRKLCSSYYKYLLAYEIVGEKTWDYVRLLTNEGFEGWSRTGIGSDVDVGLEGEDGRIFCSGICVVVDIPDTWCSILSLTGFRGVGEELLG